MTCSRARSSFSRFTGDHFSSLLPQLTLFLSFFPSLPSAKLVTSLVTSCQSWMPPPFSSRLASDFASPRRAAVLVILISARRLSLSYLRPFSSSNPCSCFVFSALPSVRRRRSLFLFAAGALPETGPLGKDSSRMQIARVTSYRKITAAIFLISRLTPDFSDFYY